MFFAATWNAHHCGSRPAGRDGEWSILATHQQFIRRKAMERNQRRHAHPGREHRPESSRRPYSDEQETYRNPRNEYRDDDERDDRQSRYGRSDFGDRDRDFEEGESNRYGAAESGYGYGDRGYRDEYRERYEPGYAARRQGQSRDTWEEPESGNFSDARTRWPRDDRYRSEPRSQNWPHSRTGGRVSEYGYFGDESEGYGGRQHSGSRYGGSRPQRGYQSGYGAEQQGSSQFGYLGGSEEPGESRWSSQHDYRQQGGSQFGYGQREGGAGHGDRRFDEDYSGRGPKNYSRSDERIKEDICDELSSDPGCNAEEIEIEVKDGMVTLSGTVPSRKMKHRAEDIADGARGVKDVDNRIRVTGRVGHRGMQSSEESGSEDTGSSTNGRSRKSESQSQQSSRSSRK
jgi:osmotically-inducible protein OsmY